MDNNYVITIARGFGSGGKEIASNLAKKLGIHCYENRILTLASQLSGLDKDIFETVDEKKRNGFFQSLLKGIPRTVDPKPVSEKFVSDNQLFEFQKQIIINLSEKESCVIVGKCADWILKNKINVFSVYIEAPREFCVDRIKNKMSVTEEVAHKSIDKTDKYRAEYYRYYTQGNYWTNPVNYDLTLNSQKLGLDNCVDIIIYAMQKKGLLK